MDGGKGTLENMGLVFPVMLEGFYQDKTVVVTGHTGFKGSWLSLWLHLLGAKVIGYAQSPATPKDNFVLSGLEKKIIDIRGDIRDAKALENVFDMYKPDIVFHLAAQPIVRRSYEEPLETFQTNIMGTVNILEQIRKSETAKVGLMITSDKCYENMEQIWGYREQDKLGGFDPYSASKGCAEIVSHAYLRSFFNPDQYKSHGKAVATLRAGNVIGGGDWSQNRIIPDCIRALEANVSIKLRNPASIRPWQHVLEPLYGYLLLASKMWQGGNTYSGAWNFGPEFDSVVTVKRVVDLIIDLWGTGSTVDASPAETLHEAGLLNLDCTKAKTMLCWKPKLNLPEALAYTIDWYKQYDTTDVFSLCKNQIIQFLSSS